MAIAAWVLFALSSLTTGAIAKMLIVDIAWSDYRSSTASSWMELGICSVLGLAFVGVPAALQLWLIRAGHPGWAMVMAVGAILLSLGALLVLAPAFTP